MKACLRLVPGPILTALLMAVAVAGAVLAPAPASAQEAEVQIQAHPELNEDGIHVQPWIKYPKVLDIPKAARTAAEAGKTLMVIYEQPGCVYCRRMHTENFTNPTLVKYLVKNFDVYQLDMISDKPVIGPEGETQSQADMASENRVTGTPTTLFFDENAEEDFRLPGYLPTGPHYAALQYVVMDGAEGNLSIAGFRTWISAHSERLTRELEG